MIKRRITTVALGLLVTVASVGCANRAQDRIAMLEQANYELTERVNEGRSEIDAALGERDDLYQRLEAALRELDDLNAQLAAMPEPGAQAPGWTAVPGGAMIAIEGEILFRSGKTTVREEARRALDAIVSAVQGDYAGKQVFVFGHTDDTPIKKSGWKDNWQLSTERALAVARHLRDQGVAPGRIVACGCGEYRPRIENSSGPNRARNRRVEIFAIDPTILGDM